MSSRFVFAAGLLLTAVVAWVSVSAQSPQPAAQKPDKKNPPKNSAKKNAKQGNAKGKGTGGTPSPVVDMARWPTDDTITVRLALGRGDREPTNWDGSVSVTGTQILRVRPWRFDNGMSVDESKRSWKCGSWLGPVPLDRVFDRHLPDRPRPFVTPTVLIDLPGSTAFQGRLAVTTSQGDFTVDVEKLRTDGSVTVLDGRVRAEVAPFGFPLAARAERDKRMWYDEPALAVRGDGQDEVAVSYLAYSQDTTSDAIFVRRRLAGRWQDAELVSAAEGDHYRSAVGFDGRGGLWVVYAAQVDGNWDLYGRYRHSDGWRPAVRLTDHQQPDIQQVLVADRQGGLWLVWQGFRDGQSDIWARRWSGDAWGAPARVSDSPANDWNPSATPLPAGGIAVAWDNYAAGNYDVFCRATNEAGGSWGEIVPITTTENLEARATIAADGAGRLWVAYDTSGPYWGKDTGFMLEIAKAPQGTRLYESRGVSVAIYDPAAKRLLAPADPAVSFESLNSTLHEHVEYPQLQLDDRGCMWLVMRRRAMFNYSRRGVGRQFGCDVVVSRFDTTSGRWSEPMIVADSLGRQDSLSGVGVGQGKLWLAWSCDHREYLKSLPDASSIFAGYLSLNSPVQQDVSRQQFTPPPSRAAASPPPSHPNEAADVARLRNHAIQANGKTYHIYRGDMHRHTETSSDGGGDGSMQDVYRYALDAAAMDFLLVTDHHDGGREYDWWRREKFNDLFLVGEAFVGLFGYERSLSYPNGHRNVFFPQRGIRPLANLPQEGGRDPTGSGQFLYPHLREKGGICFSHTSATGMGTDWRDNDPELEPLVEIFQGDRTNYEKLGAPWSAQEGDTGTQEGGFQPLGYVNLALAKGYKLGFQASSDHLSTHLSYSCILAERNTREGLMEAMKKRHAYAATDNILLDVRAAGLDGEHIMGDIFAVERAPKLKATVVGTGPLAEVVLIKDDRVVYSSRPAGHELTFEFTDMQSTAGKESYYYVRVVQADRRIAWSSPMWITRR